MTNFDHVLKSAICIGEVQYIMDNGHIGLCSGETEQTLLKTLPLPFQWRVVII